MTQHFLLQFSDFDSQGRLSCQMLVNAVPFSDAEVFLFSEKTATCSKFLETKKFKVKEQRHENPPAAWPC